MSVAKIKVPVIPVLEYPDGSFDNDSTPLIYDLEQRHDERSVIPDLEIGVHPPILSTSGG